MLAYLGIIDPHRDISSGSPTYPKAWELRKPEDVQAYATEFFNILAKESDPYRVYRAVRLVVGPKMAGILGPKENFPVPTSQRGVE